MHINVGPDDFAGDSGHEDTDSGMEEHEHDRVRGEGGQAPPSPLAVAPPPPPAVPRVGGGRRAGTSYARYDVHDATGAPIGYITWNIGSKSIDAHCSRHAGNRLDCAVNRTVTGSLAKTNSLNRSAQGRPLGFLIAWLRCGVDFEAGPAGRDAHHAVRLAKEPYTFLADGTGCARLAARTWAMGPGRALMQPLSDVERLKRAGEPEEPRGLP